MYKEPLYTEYFSEITDVMSYWRFLLLVTFFFTNFQKTVAQKISNADSSKIFFVNFSLHGGGIATESRLKPLAQSHPVMLQLDFSFIKNTREDWDQCMCYSRTGLSLSYVDFNNEKKLGKAINLSIFAEPYLYYTPRFTTSIKAGVGLSYLTNVYDSITNPENLFFSSSVSFLLTVGITASFKVSPAFDIGLATQFNHISNGGSHYPNWGINFPTLALRIGYQIGKHELINRIYDPLLERPLKLVLRASAGRHLEAGTKKVVTGINVGLIKHLTRINGVGLGMDVMYDPIYGVLQDKRNIPYNTFITSVSLQHYFFYKRILFGQQLAYYLIPPNTKLSTKIFQIYSLEYYLTHQWHGGVLLKAHGGISDYLILSISRVIRIK